MPILHRRAGPLGTLRTSTVLQPAGRRSGRRSCKAWVREERRTEDVARGDCVQRRGRRFAVTRSVHGSRPSGPQAAVQKSFPRFLSLGHRPSIRIGLPWKEITGGPGGPGTRRGRTPRCGDGPMELLGPSLDLALRARFQRFKNRSSGSCRRAGSSGASSNRFCRPGVS